jgi:hypothetical protein
LAPRILTYIKRVPDSQDQPVRRLVYVSVAVGTDRKTDRADILRSSRVNNALDGVTGLLWSDGDEYVQVVEGSETAVAAVFERIRADPRHSDVVILSDQKDLDRAFAYWTMAAAYPGDDVSTIRPHLDRFMRDAPEDVRQALVQRHIGGL